MVNKKEFKTGWDYALELGVGQYTDYVGQRYISKVASAIDQLEESINAYSGSKKGIPQLGGELAENMHAGTFNIRAAAAESSHRVFVEKSGEHASVDISTNFGKNYSLKYLKYADKSVEAQSKNVIQNYHEYLSRAKANGTKAPMTFEQYLNRYDYSNDLEDLLMSVYRGQERLIPADQLQGGIKKLNLLIAKEYARGSDNRLNNLKNYSETLQRLCDRITDGEGIESIPLTKEQAHAIAELCKTGDFKAEDFGISLNSEITTEYLLNQALKGGITAAVVTFAISSVPQIIELLAKLSNDNKIDNKELRAFGLSAIGETAKGFMTGYISCGVYTACKAGKFGSALVDVQPGAIGTIAALILNMITITFDYSRGVMNTMEYKYNITKSMVISVGSLVGGALLASALPIANAIAFAVGSLAGSVIASVSLSVTERILVSIGVDSGYTLFGLVKQDYSLPKGYFQNIGINITEVNHAIPNHSRISRAQLHKSSPNRSRPNHVDVKLLKRGLIAFHVVGYIF